MPEAQSRRPAAHHEMVAGLPHSGHWGPGQPGCGSFEPSPGGPSGNTGYSVTVYFAHQVGFGTGINTALYSYLVETFIKKHFTCVMFNITGGKRCF